MTGIHDEFQYRSQSSYIIVEGSDPFNDGSMENPIITHADNREEIEIFQEENVGNSKVGKNKKSSHKNQTYNKTKKYNAKREHWSSELYGGFNTGSSTIFNIGAGKENQSASFTTDGLIGCSIIQNKKDNSGLFFDINAGLRYDMSFKSSPNRHRGGPVGNITLGYKMPVYENKTTNITWDNYVTGHAAYCSDGADNTTLTDREIENQVSIRTSQPVKYINEIEKHCSNKYPWSSDMAHKQISLEKQDMEITSFDGKKIKYNWYRHPNLDTYNMRAGMGTGFTFNFDTNNDRYNDLSISLGVEGGIHKTGPEIHSIAEVRTDITYKNGEKKSYTDVVEYYQPDYQNIWYATPKFKLSYNFDSTNTKEISLSTDEHGVFLSGRFGILSKDFSVKHKQHKKR